MDSSLVSVPRQDEHKELIDFEAFRARAGVDIATNRKFNTVGKKLAHLSKNTAYDPLGAVSLLLQKMLTRVTNRSYGQLFV